MDRQVYLAGSLFNEKDTDFNIKVAKLIEASTNYSVYLPQNEGGDFDEPLVFPTAFDRIDTRPDTSRYNLFLKLKEKIKESQVVVAICEGSELDDGTSIELGIANTLGIPIVAVRSDFRGNGDTKGFNLMVWGVTTFFAIGQEWQPRLIKALQRLEHGYVVDGLITDRI